MIGIKYSIGEIDSDLTTAAVLKIIYIIFGKGGFDLDTRKGIKTEQ